VKCAITGIAVALCIGINSALSGCAHLPRQEAVPAALTASAMTTALADARYWPELDQSRAVTIAALAAQRERESLPQSGRSSGRLPPANYLAISSGGDEGAFAAGLLVGWTTRGDRPAFSVVTGVSAGALVAPFAFLGSKYDAALRAVSSRIRQGDILQRRNWVAALTGDSMADDRPLASMIEKYINQDLLHEIAGEYARGRLLFVATTNLDARELVVWDMGAIASRGDDAALDLFRKIILASMAVPGVFPPVMIDVEANGRRYQEMHVDGAVMTQVFLFPYSFMPEREQHIYVIRNGRIDAQWRSIERRTAAVAHRALDALVDRQALSDMYRLQSLAQQYGADLNIAYIDSGFIYPHRAPFAGDYMQHLFQYSCQLAAGGYRWSKALPTADGPQMSLASARD
jgi:predicted acylesterase/phospholipase RssA